MKPFYKDDLATIYCGDSLDVLPTLSRKDLALMDPPYGLRDSWKRRFHGNNGETKLWGETPEWDKQPVSEELLKLVLQAGDSTIMWGGNFYPLPPSRCWFVWDKLQSERGADCELAWTNLDLPPKVFRMSRIDAYQNQTMFKKEHGAEKPIQLMKWCLHHAKPKSVIDPFMGVGSTLVACKLLGIPCVGIELDVNYCKEAARRLRSPLLTGFMKV